MKGMRCAMAWVLMGWSLLAQVPWKRQDASVWLQPHQVLFIPYVRHPQGPATLYAFSPQKRSVVSRRLPFLPKELKAKDAIEAMGWVEAVDGSIFYVSQAIDRKKTGEMSSIYRFYRFDLDRWQWEPNPWGEVDSSIIAKLILLSEDRFLALAGPRKPFKDGQQSYPMAIFRRNDQGQFRIQRYLDVGLKKPAYGSGDEVHYPFVKSLWIDAVSVHTAHGKTVLFSGCGLGWIFDAKGTMRGPIRLYEGLTEEALQDPEGLFGGMLLGAQPKDDGDVLLSAFDEDALVRGCVLEKTTQNAQNHRDYLHLKNRSMAMLVKGSPRVGWYVLDVDAGTLREEVPPAKVPTFIRSEREYLDFNWVFSPDGNLRFYTEAELVAVDPKAPKHDWLEMRLQKTRVP